MNAILLGVALLASPQSSSAPQFEGEQVLERIVTAAKPHAKKPIGEIMAAVSDQFLGTPYVGWTLERDPSRESCTVTLLGLDCVTFFETTLGIARMVRAGGSQPKDLLDQVTLTRYRGGKVDGYASRLHYTSDWMQDNAEKGTVQDLSPSLPGAKPFEKTIEFMTKNRSIYQQFESDPNLVERIAATERALNAKRLWFVPLASVRQAEEELRTGDIIGITTSQAGMDCSHTGMIRVIDGVPRFMHASSGQKKVVLDVRLSDYLKVHSRATGIMAVRPK